MSNTTREPRVAAVASTYAAAPSGAAPASAPGMLMFELAAGCVAHCCCQVATEACKQTDARGRVTDKTSPANLEHVFDAAVLCA